jgi:hypothetical protein
MYVSSEYNRTFKSNYTYINTVLPPVLNISIDLSGKCVDGENSLELSYSLINDTSCAIDQRFYSVDREEVKTILQRNGLLQTYTNYDLFNATVNRDKKWNLDLEYAFYRNTLTCLMMNYNSISSKTTYFGNIGESRTFDIQQQKIRNILKAFATFDTSFSYQKIIQIFILALNSIIVFFNVITLTSKIIALSFYCCLCIKLFVYYEKLISFIFDIVLAVLGASSFFILYQYVNLISAVVDSDCVDNYTQYKFGSFANTLQDTAESNFQIFIIMIIKIFFIVFSISYYLSCKRCRLSFSKFWEIVMENINEGDEENNILVDNAHIEKLEEAEFGQLSQLNRLQRNEVQVELANGINENNKDYDQQPQGSIKTDKKDNDILKLF